jgi:hypothetical protein
MQNLMQEISIPNDPTTKLTSDYSYAKLHLAWYRNDQQRSLVFGMMELLPNEFPKPIETDEIDKRIGTKGRRYIYLRRFIFSIEEAIQWYKNCRAGTVILPEFEWDNSANHDIKKSLAVYHFAPEPIWPQLNTANELPFVPDCHICPRVHHLIPTQLSNELETLKSNETVLNWLSQQFYFNFQEYSEYLGSLHLVAPNPVIRRFENKLTRNDTGLIEAEMYFFMPRAGYTLDGLQLIVAEKRPTGIASIRCIPLNSNLLKVEYPHCIEQVATAIVCPERGVLYWSEPLYFMRLRELTTIKNTNVKKSVSVPASENKKAFTYEVPVKKISSRTIGNISLENKEAASILLEAEKQRQQRQEGERFGQQWFHGNQEDAELFVRNLITEAQSRVVIVDPYFGTSELFNFALATSNPKTEVCILSSAEVLKEADNIYHEFEAGDVLLKHLEHLKAEHQESNLSAKVMIGKRPNIHDRFLIIDDQVWLSGNSLNEIGKRAGVIVKLPYPDPIRQHIEQILQECLSLKTWVEKRKQNRTDENISVEENQNESAILTS